jgi:hypothetical protein
VIIGKTVELFDGQEIIDTLVSAGVVVAPGGLGVAVASLDADGNLCLEIDVKDLTNVKTLLKDWLV